MKTRLDKISINGFKSIKALHDFSLESLNIMVGCNGAGKSNFMDFFRMLSAMSQESLVAFITEKGGPDGFFYNGPAETKKVDAHLVFGENEYRFDLTPTVNGLMVKNEEVMYKKTPHWKSMGGGTLESGLKSWKGQSSRVGSWPSVEHHVYEAVSDWTIYHFHDTGMTATMRRDQPVRDRNRLNPDASNIAAFLLSIHDHFPNQYQHIISTIQLVAPFFDDFILEPEKKGENEVVRLEWRQKGSQFPFQPWQLSDGSIRFICLATALLQPDPTLPSTILIDEPELGLHPFALDVLAGLIRDASTRTQVIVSTQSSPLLNHFEPEEIIVVDRKAGASQFKRLEREPLTKWLEQYSLGELWHKNIFEGGPVRE